MTNTDDQVNMILIAFVELRSTLEIEMVSILVVAQVATESGSGEIHEIWKETGDMDREIDPGIKEVTIDDFAKALSQVGEQGCTPGVSTSHMLES